MKFNSSLTLVAAEWNQSTMLFVMETQAERRVCCTPSIPTSNVISATVYNIFNDREYLQIMLSLIMSDFEGLTKGKQLNNVSAFIT